MTRVLVDGRLTASAPSGVRDIAIGLVEGLRATAGEEGHELVVVGTEDLVDVRLPVRGFMHARLPVAAARLRANALLVPRQTRPVAALIPTFPLFHDIGFMTRPEIYADHRAVRLANHHAMAARNGFAVSEFTADELQTAGARAHVTVLPFGAVHPVRWAPSMERPYLLCVAAQEPHKNLVRLVEAWREVAPSDCRLVLCGRRGADTPRLLETLRRLDLRESVELLHGVPDLEYGLLMAGCWGYVQPSLYEGLCIPALDLAAAGAPSVVSDQANLGRVFGGTGHGQTFDPCSVEQMVTSLTSLVFDTSLRHCFSSWNRGNVMLTDWALVGRTAWRAMSCPR